jgi:acyl-coenzyme A thioesterase PaaI-like protein
VIDDETAALVAEMRADYPHCFACGPDNPVGLHLAPARLDGGVAMAAFDPSPHHVGADDVLHGGLAATVLDEIMVWAAILTHRVLCVTGTMEIRFRRPVSVTQELVVRGLVEDRRGRRLRCSAELAAEDGTAVTASGLYLVSRTLDEGSGD